MDRIQILSLIMGLASGLWWTAITLVADTWEQSHRGNKRGSI